MTFTPAQKRALGAIAKGLAPRAHLSTLQALARKGCVRYSNHRWRITRQGQAAYHGIVLTVRLDARKQWKPQE